ncbi:hypothetical protein RAMDARK_0569 [Rickettsia amblyommatis str. Darkwater]|uniref:Uncharacterized protein n=1 Tax=Rickettsia amblyommatis str. Ac/Pa TaxID=1359164 RepID=A0A0F3N1Q8_RICAM|nr:hypothetical protein APHACPA_0827 [Rickettsia amblyommatis str. Ac/Pa]KJV96913.1 hypothetical protein RAMDARK_0569 [Rickettsia amblyommatis str. Darkwater]
MLLHISFKKICVSLIFGNSLKLAINHSITSGFLLFSYS